MQKYDYVVYIGRFQPFHDGHLYTLKQAYEQGHRVIIGIGSSNRSRSTDNPFTFDERLDMIAVTLTDSELEKTEFISVSDYPYNDTAWIVHVTSSINELITLHDGKDPNACSIALIGFKKDDSSRYLDYFPNWTYIGAEEQHGIMSATDVRNHYFQKGPIISEFLPEKVRSFMKGFAISKHFAWLLHEFDYIREYPRLWGDGPFFTVDAVVEQMGYVLLVTRKEAPFKGKFAMPGGFLNRTEWIKEARVRELKEETRLSDCYFDKRTNTLKWSEMPPAKIMSFLTKEKIYDDPRRSARGRVITFAGLFNLPPSKELYHVKGDDDAEKAAWYSLSDLNAAMFMEDHYFIIQDMLGVTEGI